MEQSIYYNLAFKVVFVQFAQCRNHVKIASDMCRAENCNDTWTRRVQ